jgi:hypothetical protein
MRLPCACRQKAFAGFSPAEDFAWWAALPCPGSDYWQSLKILDSLKKWYRDLRKSGIETCEKTVLSEKILDWRECGISRFLANIGHFRRRLR